MAVRARVDRHKCIGAGNCITLAPTAFDWLAGDFGKADVLDPETVALEMASARAYSANRSVALPSAHSPDRSSLRSTV